MFCGAFRDAQNHSCILHREKALRHHDVKNKVRISVPTVTSSVVVWCLKTHFSVRP